MKMKRNSNTATNRIDKSAIVVLFLIFLCSLLLTIVLNAITSVLICLAQSGIAEHILTVLTHVAVLPGISFADPLFVLFNRNVKEALKEKISKYCRRNA